MLGLPYKCLPYLSFGHPAHRHRSPLDGIVWALSKWSIMSSGKRQFRFGTNCFSSEFICFAHHLSKQQKQRFQTKRMAHNQPAKALLVHFIKYATWAMFICFSGAKKLKFGYLDTSRPSQLWVLSLCRGAGETAIPCGPRPNQQSSETDFLKKRIVKKQSL